MRWIGYGKKEEWKFVGKYFYDGATLDEPIIHTFKTRKEARLQKDKKENKFSVYKVVKVSVIVKEIKRDNSKKRI